MSKEYILKLWNIYRDNILHFEDVEENLKAAHTLFQNASSMYGYKWAISNLPSLLVENEYGMDW